MSTVGIVALSLLVGAFILAMLALSGWLVYLLVSFRRDLIGIRDTFRTFTDDTTNTLTLHRTELRKAFESQSASISARVSEFDDVVTSLSAVLESHRKETNHAIQRINGEQLSKEVAKFQTFTQQAIAAATRIERAAVAIGTFTREWLSERAIDESITPLTEGIDTSTGYAAVAPGEQPFVSRSRTAADDAAVIEEESAHVTQTDFTG